MTPVNVKTFVYRYNGDETSDEADETPGQIVPAKGSRLNRNGKQWTVFDLRKEGFDLRLAFEDDRRNVAMFRSQGIPTLYVHSGYYD